jgi:hypothetical protein
VKIVPPPAVRLKPPALPGQPGQLGPPLPVFGDPDDLEPVEPEGSRMPGEVVAKTGVVPEARTGVVPEARAGVVPERAGVVPEREGLPEAATLQFPAVRSTPEHTLSYGELLPQQVLAFEPVDAKGPVPAVPAGRDAGVSDADGRDASGPIAADDDEGDRGLAGPVVAGTPVVVFDFDDTRGLRPGEVQQIPARRPRVNRPHERRTVRKTATGAAAAVVVGAIAVGGWQLVSHRNVPPVAPPPVSTTTSLPSKPVSGGTATSTTTTTTIAPVATTPSTLRPLSSSTTLATYEAPAGTYTVTFKATTGECWLGAQRAVDTTAYLQMWSLGPGETASYTASGPLVVKIGAPKYVKVEVDGIPVVLPPGNVQAFDISFVASSGTPA